MSGELWRDKRPHPTSMARDIYRVAHGVLACCSPIADWQMRVIELVMDARSRGVRVVVMPRRKS